MNWGGRVRYAHRIAYEVHRGPIPKGALVCHKCDNPLCIAPKHLWLGSHRDNAHDREKKGRGNPATGEKHGHVKLTDAQALAIYDDTRDALTISREYGVTRAHVYYIKKKKTRPYLWA